MQQLEFTFEDSLLLENYQDFVESMILTKGDTRLVENTLGLVGETGEVAEKIKKLYRDNSYPSKEALEKELGDVLFYLTSLANFFDLELKEIITKNVSKLTSRKERGVLQGAGDDR